MNVILIDDDKDLIQALQQALELEDIQVQCFRNPAKALKIITDDFDGAIITDVNSLLLRPFAAAKRARSFLKTDD